MMWRVRLIPLWIYLIRGQLMGDAKTQTIYFYDRHPISSDIILAKLRSSRGDLNSLRPDELFPHDQDHYAGLAATDELARGAQIGKTSQVADFCAGLGGMSDISHTNMEPTSQTSN